MEGEPAFLLIAKPAAMTGQRTTYFRWTPRTAGITFMYAVVVPGILGTLAYQVDVSFPFFFDPRVTHMP